MFSPIEAYFSETAEPWGHMITPVIETIKWCDVIEAGERRC